MKPTEIKFITLKLPPDLAKLSLKIFNHKLHLSLPLFILFCVRKGWDDLTAYEIHPEPLGDDICERASYYHTLNDIKLELSKVDEEQDTTIVKEDVIFDKICVLKSYILKAPAKTNNFSFLVAQIAIHPLIK